MKYPADVVAFLIKKFQKWRCEWLNQATSSFSWPLKIQLNMPSESDVIQQPQAVRDWITAWQQWKGSGTLIPREKNWRTRGSQILPFQLILQTPEDVMSWIGQSHRFALAKNRFSLVTACWPQLTPVLSRYFDMLADYNEMDFQRLMNLVAWLIANPQSGLYPRQLPIAGMDSKWLEQHKSIIFHFMSVIRSDDRLQTNDFERCGLKSLPTLLRFRVLDPQIRQLIGGLSDLSIPWDDAKQLHLSASNILIVENLQTGLALPDLSDTIVIMGLGYHVDKLSSLPIIANATVFYWGDIDTHGFAILNRLRSYLPQVQSLLMDEKTLLHHQALWVTEDKPHPAETLPFLSDSEHCIYQGLKQHRWQYSVRLEQERIEWQVAMSTIHSHIRSLSTTP